jgi:hypothetical protein
MSDPCVCVCVCVFEFKGKKYPKAKHRFTLNKSPFMAIASLWREGKNGARPAFTMLTTEPSPDVDPYHNRQVVVLKPQDWAHGRTGFISPNRKRNCCGHSLRDRWRRRRFVKAAIDP